MTQPFKAAAYFDQVFLDFGALTWPNGYDWCPDSLHADMQRAGRLKSENAN